jgi:amino acid adenylation domain-containing protein
VYEALRQALGRRAVPGFSRVFAVASGDRHDGPRALRIRETERRRPLAPGVALRCVLLIHLDGSELVLVADRRRLPLCCLTAMVEVTTEPGRAADGRIHLAAPGSHTAGVASSIDLVAAVGGLCAAVLRRDPVATVLEEDGAEPAGFLTSANAAPVAVPVLPENAQVGVTVTAVSPDDYLPLLSPRHPVDVVAYRDERGSVRTGVLVDESRVDPGTAEVLATQLPRRLAAGSGSFVLEPSEVADVLRAGRGPDLAAPMAGSVPAAFAAIAAVNGERVAVTGDGGSLTYAELDETSSAVASALVARGMRRGERVGVCMQRTPRAVVALLAVLRAGGCYVPLDPAHPPARRAYVAADAGLRSVITDGDAGELPAGVSALSLDELTSGATALPSPPVGAGDAAYVIYTSGTTGDPKGTVIPHRNVMALLAATRPAMHLDTSDVWSGFHSFAFDFSVWEIWGCLLTGGRLVVVPYWTARTPAAFALLLRDEGVTVLSQTPSAFVNLIPAVLDGDVPRDLRLVVFGGEALRRPALVPWIRHVPLSACRLINMYGITETTVHVTCHEITAADVVANSRSVGRALPGWSVSVRSAGGRVLPFGVAGEICVGGVGLARGYLGRPELTHERFPVDPATGERYYRSGDLGLLRPDGTVEHFGRLDDQVKIRGYRVELGEIRAALLDDPGVRDAVVSFRETGDGGEIHAFVVADGLSAADLRRRLGAKLPGYMIPAGMRKVAALPLTANGKADLAALMAQDDGDQGRPRIVAVAGPTSSPEVAVRQVWDDVLGAADPEDDFFSLGGTSLQALKIASALNGLGIRAVEPRDIYMNPTLEDLTAFLAKS